MAELDDKFGPGFWRCFENMTHREILELIRRYREVRAAVEQK